MHTAFANAKSACTRREAIELASTLTTRTVLGMDEKGLKKNSLAHQAFQCKAEHPQRIVILRVGEFYELFGIDAVVTLEACPTLEPGKLGASVHASRIQTILNGLIDAGWTAALFEESKVICTPRHRFLAQIVSAATPHYCMANDSVEVPVAKKIAGIEVHNDQTATVCLLDAQQHLCQRYDQVSMTRAQAVLVNVATPIYALRRIPSWLANEDVVLLGGASDANVAERLIDHVSKELVKSPIVVVPVSPSRCAPLPRFTLQQLGLSGDFGLPDLSLSALPSGTPAPVRRQLVEWLEESVGPCAAAAHRTVLRVLQTTTCHVPTFAVAASGRRHERLRVGRADAATIKAIRHNARILLEVPDLVEPLLAITCKDMGRWINLEDVRALVATVDEFLAPEDVEIADLRGTAFALRVSTRRDRLAAVLDMHRGAQDALREGLSAWGDDELVRDARGIAVRGRPDGADKKPVFDRNHRILPGQYTTHRLQIMEEGTAVASRQVLDADAGNVDACARALHAHLPAVCITESLSLRISTLIAHARASVAQNWTLPDVGEMQLKQLRPYWMDWAVLNDLEVSEGNVILLTAPNGGGKSTMLRVVGACLALHQSGLMSPCATGSRMPTLDGLFLRSGSLDSPHERRSSFAAEMHDLRVIMQAPGTVIALLDEPCRGTRVDDGRALLSSVVQHFSESTTAIVSTHFDDLATDKLTRVRHLQMGARVVDGDCRPDFVLQPGTCHESLALHMALAAGLPIGLVAAARRNDDIRTLLLTVFYEMGVTFEELQPGNRPAPGLKSTLYVLDTVDGVYVGESDHMWNRIATHKREKPCIRAVFLASCANKSAARALESKMINELRFHNVHLLSDTDGMHSAFF